MLRTFFAMMMIALIAPSSAQAAAVCNAYKADALLNQVPYFFNRMTSQSSKDGLIRLVHKDDPGIAASFVVEELPETLPVSRTSYLNQLQKSVDLEVNKRESAGIDSNGAVFPYDPIAWTIVSHPGNDVATGTTSIRLSPRCSLVIDWTVHEIPALASRVDEFKASLDALRTLTATRADAGGFLSERALPGIWQSMLVGLVLPILAAYALGYALKQMLILEAPSWLGRIFVGAIVAFAVASTVLQWPVIAEYLDREAFVDHVGLVGVVGLTALAGLLTNRRRVMLAAYCLATVAGLTIGVAAILDWVPIAAIAVIVAIAFTAFGVLGLSTWQYEATSALRRRTTRSA